LRRFQTTLLTAFVIAILYTPAASAQATAARVDVISGNGQMICPACAQKNFTLFYPMVVKVTDANGNPIANKTVNWQLVSGTSAPSFDTTTTTDANGLSISRLFQGSVIGGNAQTPYVQSVINAYADSASTNFTETVALTSSVFFTQLVFSQRIAPVGSTPLSGPAGGTGTDPIKVHIDGGGLGVPGVSVRILNPDPKTLPSASCATSPGADPGSVLSDANGDATCFPVFGPVAGNSPVIVLVGGLDPAQFDQSISPQPLQMPLAFDEYPGVQLAVTPVTPGRLAVISGNNQSINPGQSSAPLVVQLTDASGGATIANTPIAWTVSPAGAATLSQTSTTTDSQGKTQTNVTFSPSAVGQVTVKATLTSNSSISATFVLATNVQISSLTKVSGDTQSTQAGKAFPSPLVVQVMGTNGQPVVNQPVSFNVTGGATLSATSALTDATGKAQVTVTAGATPGAVTVNAFIGSVSQTFNLTISPPGPSLSTNSFYNAGGSIRLSALSPCSLVTVISSGLAPNVQGIVLNTNGFGPWATTLANDSVSVGGVAAPIYSVGNVGGVEQLTFQVPCETGIAGSVPITVNVSGGTATVNLPVQAATPGIFETSSSDGTRRAVAIRPDGSFVTLQNPARRGEIIRVFVTGMGPASPAIVTGALPFAGVDSLISGQVIVGVANAGARVVTSRVSPNLLGVNEIAFQVASDSPTGNDVVLSVAVNVPGDSATRFSNGSKLPIVQ
jgi:uncharacterized protein (TIGR03437 family)